MTQKKPMTYEQIWGAPAACNGEPIPRDYCPYKEHTCPWWDGDCMAEACDIERE